MSDWYTEAEADRAKRARWSYNAYYQDWFSGEDDAKGSQLRTYSAGWFDLQGQAHEHEGPGLLTAALDGCGVAP